MKGTPGRLEQVDVLVEQKTFMSTCATDRGPEKSFANQVINKGNKSKHAVADPDLEMKGG